MTSIFDTLVELPLFRGVSRRKMADTVGAFKFHFLKYPAGERVFRAGEECVDLTFVLSGRVRITCAASDGRFSVEQTLAGPEVVAPDFLFGRITAYPGDVTAIDTVSVLRVSKSDYLEILRSDPVFLINYVNLLSMSAQKSVEGVLAVGTGSMAERIAFWVSALTQPRATGIRLRCSRRDLASLFGVQRSSLKATLDAMTADGLITHTASEIAVTDRRSLLALLHNHSESLDD
ncbi:MAG: Crp/Fnr family transcriptional regulator [Bacteroides sp.]|nr:Crp/Fnr family transcriptional regulator [Bacteroides sp.]MCM1095111.1 Crp/Fnr family transcriptional regulator [Terasakiella sp.]